VRGRPSPDTYFEKLICMPKPQLSRFEFVALMAMMFATVAFSIDAMLPGLPDIGATLSPDAPNRAQLIVTSFVLGMGLATFVIGPLSDAYGLRNRLRWCWLRGFYKAWGRRARALWLWRSFAISIAGGKWRGSCR
jgi:MFS family permease